MGPRGGAGAAVTLYAVAGVRGGLHAHPHVLCLMASLSPSFLHHLLRREGERELVCVVGRPSKRLKRGRNKTDRWREEGEGEGWWWWRSSTFDPGTLPQRLGHPNSPHTHSHTLRTPPGLPCQEITHMQVRGCILMCVNLRVKTCATCYLDI